ncbi:MAG: nitric oxide reductase activation protein [Magnetococcales bacterium]|nr:nitric oxide reductase activation protein [Magnetococcales bacterium]
MATDPNQLGVDELEEQLEEVLEAALSSRRTAIAPARELAARSPQKQQAMLHWLPILAKINPEMAFQCAARMSPVLDDLEIPDLERWLEAVMDRFDREGLQSALSVLKKGPPVSSRSAGAVLLADISGLLGTFVVGLGGRRLGMAEAHDSHTDTETIFLPPAMALADSEADNLKLYRALTAHLWGLGRFGTFFPELPQTLAHWPDMEVAARVYLSLERWRIDAVLARQLPGLGRVMASWQGAHAFSEAWQPAIQELAHPGADRNRSLAWLGRLYDTPIPPRLPYHGADLYQPAVVRMQGRLEQEKILFRKAVGEVGQLRQPIRLQAIDAKSPPEPLLELESCPETLTCALRLDGQPLLPPENLKALATSILQDLGEIPPEYLTAAGSGGYLTDDLPPTAQGKEKGGAGQYSKQSEEGRIWYDEWDFHRNSYRKRWCQLRELEISPSDDPIVVETLKKYHGLWQGIRRSFEMLRGGERWLKRQERGDEVDMDALVESLVEAKRGQEMDHRLFQSRARNDRDVATLILVDMSGSTKGWVNDAIRESLVLLCKALQVLDDRFAVYGFTGMTRNRCELYHIKHFEEAYGEEVERHIAGIKPMEYTRMGVFIRHTSQLLNSQEARIRLLITLSDGKPEDYDSFRNGYRGQYGLEDTRKALLEARQTGIHPFCITIDTEARDYMPHLFGPGHYVVLDDVRSLPLKITDIYRRWTT